MLVRSWGDDRSRRLRCAVEQRMAQMGQMGQVAGMGQGPGPDGHLRRGGDDETCCPRELS